jgi:hypothetical protein
VGELCDDCVKLCENKKCAFNISHYCYTKNSRKEKNMKIIKTFLTALLGALIILTTLFYAVVQESIKLCPVKEAERMAQHD